MQPVQAENKTLLYIYDDVTEYGEFDWNAWEYKDSETSAKYFAEKLSDRQLSCISTQMADP